MLSASALLTALGQFSHWRSELIAVYMLAFPVAFVLFARLFFGFRASRELDKEPVSPDSGWFGYFAPIYPLETAYEKAQRGDVSDLRRLAEEEEQEESH